MKDEITLIIVISLSEYTFSIKYTASAHTYLKILPFSSVKNSCFHLFNQN